MPVIEDLLSALGGNSIFTTLDLTGAYLQLALDEKSIPLTTINTHVGLFQFLRLPYGVKTAPAIFQAVMDKVLNGIQNVCGYFDDILIAGKTFDECLETVKKVLTCLKDWNITVNFNKCKFQTNQRES